MQLKYLLMILAFVSGVVFLPSSALATGTEDSLPPISTENTSSSNDFAIGGGVNDESDHDQERPGATEPDNSSDDATVSRPIDFPEDEPQSAPAPDTPTQAPTTPVTPSDVYHYAQPNTKYPTTTVSSANNATSGEPADSEPASSEESTLDIPSVPNDNVVPSFTAETPLTGAPDSTPANPLAILLLIASGVTIAAAGCTVAALEKAAQRQQNLLQ